MKTENEKNMEDSKTTVAVFEDFFSSDKYKEIVYKALKNYPESNVMVDYSDLEKNFPDAAKLLLDKPEEVLKASQKAIRNIDPFRKDVNIDVLFKNLPNPVSLNKIKSKDIGKLITANVKIVEANDIKPRLLVAVFECRSCMRLHEVQQQSNQISEPAICQECGGRSFRILQEESKFMDYQKFVLEGVNADETRQFNAIIENSLVGYKNFQKSDNAVITAIIKVLRGQNNDFEIYLYINNMEVTKRDNHVEININELIPQSNIYFISDGECVKIGKANDVKKRLQGIQTGNSKPLKLLYTMKGDERLESFLHELFADYRKVGEWFVIDGILEDFLKRGYIIGTHKTVDYYVDFFNKDGEDVEEGDRENPKSSRDKFRVVAETIKRLENEYEEYVPKHILIKELEDEFGFDEEKTDDIIRFLKRNGSIYEPKQGYLKWFE